MIFLLLVQIALADTVDYSKVFDVSATKGGKGKTVEVLVEHSTERGWNYYLNNDASELGLSEHELAKVMDQALLEAKKDDSPPPAKVEVGTALPTAKEISDIGQEEKEK